MLSKLNYKHRSIFGQVLLLVRCTLGSDTDISLLERIDICSGMLQRRTKVVFESTSVVISSTLLNVHYYHRLSNMPRYYTCRDMECTF